MHNTFVFVKMLSQPNNHTTDHQQTTRKPRLCKGTAGMDRKRNARAKVETVNMCVKPDVFAERGHVLRSEQKKEQTFKTNKPIDTHTTSFYSFY